MCWRNGPWGSNSEKPSGTSIAAAHPTLSGVSLRIGYKASAEQFGPRELVELGVPAEQRGFDSVVVSDHYQPWRHEGGHAPFSLAWMSAVGERTERVLLGTSVLTPTFRYQPAVIAQAFATMGCLFPGRVMLGVGTGEAMNEVAVTGVEWPEFKERFGRLRESVRLMRALWEGERVSFEGEYYKTVEATVYDRPDTPIPVYIAAGGPQVARYAGRAGDGFICTSGKGMELYEEKLLPAVAEGLEKAEREPDSIDRMIEIKLSYDTDPERARENTRFWAPLALTARPEGRARGPDRDGPRRRRAADRAGRQPLDRRLRPRRRDRADQALRRPRLHAPRLPRARRGPAALPRRLRGAARARAPGAQRSRLNWWARVHGPPGQRLGLGLLVLPAPAPVVGQRHPAAPGRHDDGAEDRDVHPRQRRNGEGEQQRLPRELGDEHGGDPRHREHEPAGRHEMVDAAADPQLVERQLGIGPPGAPRPPPSRPRWPA